MPNNNIQMSSSPSRRAFLKKSFISGATACSTLSVLRSAHAAGSDVIKIGMVGCGGRGSGAAANAMNAGKDIRLVAMADIFDDHLQKSRQGLKKLHPQQVAVDDDHCFVGFDAYKKIMQSDVDVVLIACTSHFHPEILKAAVDAGKHVFCEKPTGVDAPGIRVSMAACEEAAKKNLSLVSGLCWRYNSGVRETMKRIHDGDIGDVVAIQSTYMGAPGLFRKRKPEWTEMQYQLQNWYHYNWLTGGQTTQGLIHSLDKATWALGDIPPLKAWGLGGRQVHVEPKYGDQFDHNAVVFEYPNDVRVFAYNRNILGCYGNVSELIVGTKGRALLPYKPRIIGEKPWRFRRDNGYANMFDAEHVELFNAIRTGKPINNGKYMCISAMLGIMAMMVCNTGQVIGWEEALNSKMNFALPRYDWNVKPPVTPGSNGQYSAAMPGLTKFY